MAEAPVVGLRIPDELLALIDSRVGSSDGKNRSAVLLTLVKRGLNIEPSADTGKILERLDLLEKKLPTCRAYSNR